MQIWEAIVLGAVQGFSEFLPISSSGHLILLQNLFGIQNNVVFYSIMLHVGTLIPVVLVLYRQILDAFKSWKKFGLWVLASVPAGLVGLLITKLVDLDLLFEANIYLLAITFMLTAIELFYSERRCKKVTMTNDITVKTALFMGIGQAFGVIPGLSRSGTTITGGCLAKVEKEKNANFTFLMSIPIIIAAAGMQTVGYIVDGGAVPINVPALLIGMFTAAITGYIAIKFMLKIIKKANYKWFSLYLIGVSIFTLISYFVKF